MFATGNTMEELRRQLGDQLPGVFVDRRDKRIFMLRSPVMPSIIIETHNAVDDREARSWNQPHTREAFATAIVAALIDALNR